MRKTFLGLAALTLSAGLAAPALAVPTDGAATALGATQTAATAPATATATVETLQTKVERLLAVSGLDDDAKATLRALAAAAPAGAKTLVPLGAGQFGSAHLDTVWTELRDGEIDPTQYECDANTPLTEWINAEIEKLDPGNLTLVAMLGSFDYPAYDALLQGRQSSSNTFGPGGAYTSMLNGTMRSLRGFWDIKSSDIELVPMHGADVFKDPVRLKAALLAVGWDEGYATALVDLIPQMIALDPALKGGDHPLFSFNAFAFTAEGDDDPVVQGLPDKIVVGDGVLAGMGGIGLKQTGPNAVLAHEFGHHVQFERKVITADMYPSPEATRRTELMADAFATYFMTHKKGQQANKHVVLAQGQSFFNVGDCSFENYGHHGTPNQRLRAAAWGADRAAATRPASFIAPTTKLIVTFDQVLPELVAPDVQ